MKKFELIENTWGKSLIKNYGLSKKQILSEENRHILENIGLPVILNNLNYQLLPFTFFHAVELNNKFFYLIADTGITVKGTSFLGLEQNTQEVFEVYIRENGVSCLFLNQGLHQYLTCLAYYTNFLKTKYSSPSNIVNKQVKNDYQKLIDDMTKIDAKAMEDLGCFWSEQVDRLKVSGYGDYLTGREIPTGENLRTFTQEEIDNMDLPF